MSADWIAALKPGDLVIVVPGGFIRREEVGRVTARTNSGRIKIVSGVGGYERIFTPDGRQYGKTTGGCRARISPCTPDDEERITALREAESLAANLGAMSWRDWQAFPLPTLRAVRDLLAAGKGEKS